MALVTVTPPVVLLARMALTSVVFRTPPAAVMFPTGMVLVQPEAPVADAADAAAGAEVAEDDDEVPLLQATTVKVPIIRAIRANFMV